MTWRFTTINCVRVWKDYVRVGPAEHIRALLPACVRSSALALPLLAGPAVTPPARVLPPFLPWIGQPDAFGRGAYAMGGSGYGFGDAGYAPFGGFGGGYGYAGAEGRLVPPALVPGLAPAVGTAPFQSTGNGLVDSSNDSSRNLGQNQTIPQLDQLSSPGRQLERNQGQGDTPQNVPCPPGLGVLAMALLGVFALRKTERRPTGIALPIGRAASNHGVTHV